MEAGDRLVHRLGERDGLVGEILRVAELGQQRVPLLLHQGDRGLEPRDVGLVPRHGRLELRDRHVPFRDGLVKLCVLGAKVLDLGV